MERNKWCPHIVRICLVSFFSLVLCRIDFVQGFTIGKTYDYKNWQEIEGIAPPFLLNWVKNGEFILKTGKLNFDLKLEKDFLEASLKNLGKFDVNAKGFIIDKKTKGRVQFIYGLPFPKINPNDPKAGEKIMANYQYGRMRMGGHITPFNTTWIGKEGAEREVMTYSKSLYYQGRPGGPIENPSNFLHQIISHVVEPMEFRGIVMMTWTYDDERPDTFHTFVSTLRRIRRTAPTARSDPGLGSDLCPDDAFVWSGKNTKFSWRFVGEGEVLCPFTTPALLQIEDRPDGTIGGVVPPLKIGFEMPKWEGAPWAPVSVTWSPRPVWIVEGMPKEPDYNYGKQLFYVDKDTFIVWFKEIYDKHGVYWKTILLIQSYQVAPSGRTNLFQYDAYIAIDDKTHHASFAMHVVDHPTIKDGLYLPLSMLGPNDFTLSAVQELSK